VIDSQGCFLQQRSRGFLLSAVNKSQWERDRKLRTKQPTAAVLPSRSLLDLGYGIKVPKDVPSDRIDFKDVDVLHVGRFGDMLQDQRRSFRQEAGRKRQRSNQSPIPLLDVCYTC